MSTISRNLKLTPQILTKNQRMKIDCEKELNTRRFKRIDRTVSLSVICGASKKKRKLIRKYLTKEKTAMKF